MNRKKLTALIMVLALAFTTLVGGTLAYFTDDDKAENVFTMGNVKIEQHEQQRNKDNGSSTAIVDFEQNQKVFPAVESKLTPKENITVNEYDFTIRKQAGNYIDKIVNVENTGNSDAFVRTIIAIPNMNGYDDNEINQSENPLHWNYLDATDFEGTGWDWNGSNDTEVVPQTDKVAAVEIDGVEYDLYVATYNKALPAGEFTSPSMVGFYLGKTVDFDEKGYFAMQGGQRIDLSEWLVPDADGLVTLKILVASQACQTEGFDDAWEALDEAFGDITATNHPWA